MTAPAHAGWRRRAPLPHHHPVHRRRLRRGALVALTLLALAAGTTACGGSGDTQGRKDPDLSDVEAQVAQLRLEVQTLRKELAALADSVVTTTTTAPATTSSTVTR